MSVSDAETKTCKLCMGSATLKFSADLPNDMQADYWECSHCRLLQSFHLDGLSPEELAPVYDPERWLVDPDPGATWRLSYISRRLEWLWKTKMLPRRTGMKILDFGSGSGFVVSYLRHRLGVLAWGYEPYATAVFAPECTLEIWDQAMELAPYQWVIASEVFEHFIDPLAELQRLKRVLGDPSAVFITTGRYVPGEHGSDWSYLALHSGQHVALYAERTMQEVARILGFTHTYCVGGPNEWLLATPHTKKERLVSGIAAALLRAMAKIGVPAKLDRS